MTRVLVTFAGGSYGLGITRSLKAAARRHYVIGADADIYSLARAETDERHLLPKAPDPDYLPALLKLIHKTGAEMLWLGHDAEIDKVAHSREQFGHVAMFLPPTEVIDLCNDKWESYKAFLKAGVRAPETMRLAGPDDLEAAFNRGYPDGVWLRATRGAGGTGGGGFRSIDKARAWVELHDGWGHFTASEWIAGGRIFSWETVWANGKLIVGQRKSPLGQGFANVTRSGVTGVPGIVRWGGPPEAEETAEAAIRAVSGRPHGNYGVDMISDRQGRLYVTEINIARYFNDGLIHWPDEKLNAGDLAVRLAFGEPPPFEVPLKNPKQNGNVIIYGLPKMPIEVSEDELNRLRDGRG
jgi:carbamoyl-phosphate synthase large subunit